MFDFFRQKYEVHCVMAHTGQRVENGLVGTFWTLRGAKSLCNEMITINQMNGAQWIDYVVVHEGRKVYP